VSLFAEIEAQLDAVMRRDRHRLSQRLRSIRRDAKSRKPTEGNVERLREQVAKSVSEAERRRAGLPTPAFDDTLPISARRDEIRDAIRNHQVVVVCGETGSGKSTQLPKICV